jgi:hypothetical protein
LKTYYLLLALAQHMQQHDISVCSGLALPLYVEAMDLAVS